LAIFIFGFVFQFIFMADAIRLKSTVQAMLACVLNAGFLPLTIYQRKQTRESIESLQRSRDHNMEPIVHIEKPIWHDVGGLLLAMPFIVGVCTISLIISVWYLKQYFDWQSYRNVGADSRLRKIRTIHQVCAHRGEEGERARSGITPGAVRLKFINRRSLSCSQKSWFTS
jgi:hypothetical protein